MPYRELEAAPGTRPGHGDWQRSAVLDARTLTYTINGLDAAKIYEVSVRARNNAADSDTDTDWWGLERRRRIRPVPANPYIMDPPSPVLDAAAAATGTAGEIAVSWSPPATSGRARGVHYYTVRHKVSTAADSTYVTQIVPLAATSLTLEGLTSNVQHTIQVRAHSVVGHSDWVEATASAG